MKKTLFVALALMVLGSTLQAQEAKFVKYQTCDQATLTFGTYPAKLKAKPVRQSDRVTGDSYIRSDGYITTIRHPSAGFAVVTAYVTGKPSTEGTRYTLAFTVNGDWWTGLGEDRHNLYLLVDNSTRLQFGGDRFKWDGDVTTRGTTIETMWVTLTPDELKLLGSAKKVEAKLNRSDYKWDQKLTDAIRAVYAASVCGEPAQEAASN